MGEFFRKALVHYKRAHGMAETGAVDSWLIDQVPETYTNYAIPDGSAELRRDNGKQTVRAIQSSRGCNYGSLLELVAERYHSAEEFLKKLNPGMNLENLKPGDNVKVPNVLPFKIEDLKQGFAEKNPAFANRKIYIDTKDRFLLIYDDKQLVAEFPITPGSSNAARRRWACGRFVGIATLARLPPR